MNVTLYPIYLLAGAADDEQFNLNSLPFDVAEGVRIEDVSGPFSRGVFDDFRERAGTDTIKDMNSVRYALVHRYPDPTGCPQSERSKETVWMLAACLRLIRPMRQNVLLMQGRIRDEDGTLDVNQIDLPASRMVEVPDIQKLFKLRNRDAGDLRTYAPEFLRGMRGEFWKFRMAVQFHELGHFQSLDWKARFLLWCSAIESVYTSHNWEHQGSLVATSRIKWFVGENTSIYGPGDISSLLQDPHITVGQIVEGLYELRNYVAHGDRIPGPYFTETPRRGVSGAVNRCEVLIEAASFIIRASLLKILRERLLDYFADAGPAEAYFTGQGLTRHVLRAAQRAAVARGDDSDV
ncbi:MAG TPA: hypothetical protein VGS20_04485 [Candidatus Acidoferrales bacterium]|nr:hypothetical protein [Candidatus Acidoferrales bacterium]